jgi:hypothetical protein
MTDKIAFTKGQKVTLLQNWNCLGKVRVAQLTVHSCGRKRMILVDDAGEKFEGQFWRPRSDQGAFTEVHAQMAPEAAEEAALDLGARILASERERVSAALARAQGPALSSYATAMKRNLAAIEASVPSVVVYSGRMK